MTIVNRMRWLGGVLAIGGLLLLAADRAAAQTTTGTIRGYVKDSLGAPLGAAELQLRNTQTGAVRTATTSDAGSYVALVLGGFTPPQHSFIIPNAWAFRNVDIRFRKDFPEISGTSLGVTVDLFNVFNYQNLGCFNSFNPSDTNNFGKASCAIGDPRRLQIGGEYNF